MKIEQNKVGQIHYTLKNAQGDVLDTSEGHAPLSYLHGTGSLIPGMERALEGKEPGAKFKIVIPPAEAYGIKSDALISVVPLSNFPEKEQVQVGVQFRAGTSKGERIATIVHVEGDQVTVDFNHPLAGVELHFDVEIVDVREATDEEIAHGHVHGEGGHHH